MYSPAIFDFGQEILAHQIWDSTICQSDCDHVSFAENRLSGSVGEMQKDLGHFQSHMSLQKSGSWQAWPPL